MSGNRVLGGTALGGGIYSFYKLIAINSTISGNIASGTSTGAGGGVYSRNSVTLMHTTIAGNQTAGRGGGVWIGAGDLTISSSIVATNTATQSNPDLLSKASSTSVSYTLIGNNAGTSIVEAPVGTADTHGNFIGGSVHGVIDPQLGPLADNGGFVLPDGSHILTRAPLIGSPAINEGDLNAVAGVNGVPQYDERGTPFGRVFSGRIDIGAFEYQQPSDLNLVVDTLVDESDGNFGHGDLSLREAIQLANMYSGPNYPGVVQTIHFDPALTANGAAKILLTMGELKITGPMEIDGPGANLLTIDASGNDSTPGVKDGKGSRIFNIDDGTSSNISVSLAGLTLTGADTSGIGGAIFSQEDLSVINSTISGNRSYSGGGIYTARRFNS